MIKIRNKLFARKKDSPIIKTVNINVPYSETELIEIKKSKKQYYAEYFKEHVNTQKNKLVWYKIFCKCKEKLKVDLTTN